jgi:hypothetical protein
MKHILKVTAIIAVIATQVPTWAQSQGIGYSFGPISTANVGSDVQSPPSHAAGVDALRWLGGLGTLQAEPKPVPIPIAPADRQRRQAGRR